jgi:hypothetical protein
MCRSFARNTLCLLIVFDIRFLFTQVIWNVLQLCGASNYLLGNAEFNTRMLRKRDRLRVALAQSLLSQPTILLVSLSLGRDEADLLQVIRLWVDGLNVLTESGIYHFDIIHR